MGSYSRLAPGGDWDKEGRISTPPPAKIEEATAMGRLLLAMEQLQPKGVIREHDAVTDPVINSLRAAAKAESTDIRADL